MKFRNLKASEIECRVQTIKENGCSLLLYKDARVDMNMLDEAVGVFDWKREHTIVGGNNYCTVSIFDKEKKEWISKQDVGTESNTEAQKGEASDSFKRACFNWGIGRELYTAPFVWISLNADEITKRGDKVYLNPKVKFKVMNIAYTDNAISELVISDQSNKVRYTMSGSTQLNKETKPTVKSGAAAPKEPKLTESVKAAMANAKTRAELVDIWNNNKPLQYLPEFNELMKSYSGKLKQK